MTIAEDPYGKLTMTPLSVMQRYMQESPYDKAMAGDCDPPPGLVAVVSDASKVPTDLPGRPVWADIPWILLHGKWRSEDIRCIRNSSARLLVVGHCLDSDMQVASAFAKAMQTGDLQCLGELSGAYTCLIIRSGELIVITDIAGQFPVYHSRSTSEALVALHPGVLAARHARTPDSIAVGTIIACSDVIPLRKGRSPYKGIDEISGGATLHVTVRRSDVVDNWLEMEPSVSRREGVEELRAALVHAVSRRCGMGSVSADFSGGLDSSSLALLAARYSQEPVRAVTYYNPVAPAADLADAVRCAQADSRVILAVVRGTAETLPYQAIPDVRLGRSQNRRYVAQTPEPASGTLAWRRSALRLLQARDWGTRIHLTGEGGDAVLGGPPSYLADLARNFSAGRLLQHCVVQARLHQTSPALLAARALRTAVIGPAVALGRLAHRLTDPTDQTLSWSDGICWWPTSGEAISWLTARVRQNMAEVVSDPLTARTIPAGAGPADLATWAEIYNSARGQRYIRQLGQQFNVDVHAPFLDSSVVRACLRMSSWQRVDPWICKPILRFALAGLIPDVVFERRTKGDYTAEDYSGGRFAAPRLVGLFEDSRLAELGVIEPKAVLRSLERLLAGVVVPLAALNRVVSTELWLRDLEKSDTWSEAS